MSKPAAPRFPPEALRKRAGAKSFTRGEGYAGPGYVNLLSIAPDRVIAEVCGNETYGVRLTGEGSAFDAECDCLAFEDAGFCKHVVAVALVTNEMLDAGAATDTLIADIRSHLASFTECELVDYVMSLAETTPPLFRRLGFDAGLEPRDDWD
jgi:uncharacterized Zn finger protein